MWNLCSTLLLTALHVVRHQHLISNALCSNLFQVKKTCFGGHTKQAQKVLLQTHNTACHHFLSSGCKSSCPASSLTFPPPTAPPWSSSTLLTIALSQPGSFFLGIPEAPALLSPISRSSQRDRINTECSQGIKQPLQKNLSRKSNLDFYDVDSMIPSSKRRCQRVGQKAFHYHSSGWIWNKSRWIAKKLTASFKV